MIHLVYLIPLGYNPIFLVKVRNLFTYGNLQSNILPPTNVWNVLHNEQTLACLPMNKAQFEFISSLLFYEISWAERCVEATHSRGKQHPHGHAEI